MGQEHDSSETGKIPAKVDETSRGGCFHQYQWPDLNINVFPIALWIHLNTINHEKN